MHQILFRLRLHPTPERRRRVWRFRKGPGKFVISGCLAPNPPPLQKILTRFSRFTWTPLGSSWGVQTPGPARPATLLPDPTERAYRPHSLLRGLLLRGGRGRKEGKGGEGAKGEGKGGKGRGGNAEFYHLILSNLTTGNMIYCIIKTTSSRSNGMIHQVEL